MKNKHLLAAGLLALTASFTPARAVDIILHNFTGGASDGRIPQGSLTLSGATLYGMTTQGGSSGQGAVFTMNTDGSGYGLLHTFTGGASDGGIASGSLTLSGATLYGMTQQGGSGFGQGTVFSMNTDGSGFGLLHSFTSSGSDGGQPYGSLTLSGAKLYGMTLGGGTLGAGAVFSMNTDGSSFGLLHSFTNGADGASPQGSLTVSGTKLYGMSPGAGAGKNGSIFSMNTDGSGFAVLHSFTGGASDGRKPLGSLNLSGGKLYGTTIFGGSSDQGTLFSINTDGSGFSLLHTFAGGASNGVNSESSLTLSGATLYGMTTLGGSSGNGVIFSINTDGSGFGLLQSFGGAPSDGSQPVYSDLTLSGDASTLYGMTQAGGTAGLGVVFSIATPEPGSAALLGLGTLLLAARRRRSVQV